MWAGKIVCADRDFGHIEGYVKNATEVVKYGFVTKKRGA